MSIPTSAHTKLETGHSGCLRAGALIVNADDWGRDRATTERIVDCLDFGSVSSASAMVFMEDSQRSAAIACEHKLDVGLHLNFTTAFSAASCPARLQEYQSKVARYLGKSKACQAVFHPGLAGSFEYLARAQYEEFDRLYGHAPARVDGHHHMHLSANVLYAGLLTPGTIARRSFSFQAGEKSWANRFYRRAIDRILRRRHRVSDFFFSLAPTRPAERLDRIASLARQYVVEVETHPIKPTEYGFLTSKEFINWWNSPLGSWQRI